MTPEIFRLYTNRQPLPEGTRMEGVWSKQYKLMTARSLALANQVPNHVSDELPFWVVGFSDSSRDRLVGPAEKGS